MIFAALPRWAHSSGPGGVLKPHSDFHNYERLGLFRRLNVLVYLNADWTADDGGSLQMWGDAAATESSAASSRRSVRA